MQKNMQYGVFGDFKPYSTTQHHNCLSHVILLDLETCS